LPEYTKKSVHASLVIFASLRFIQCISTSHLYIDNSTIDSYLQAIESSFHKSSEAIQQVTSEALGALSQRRDFSENLTKWYRNLQGRSSFIVRRGWALGFGYIHLPHDEEVVSVLCDTIHREADIEAKRNAVKSVGLIFSRIKSIDGMSF